MINALRLAFLVGTVLIGFAPFAKAGEGDRLRLDQAALKAAYASACPTKDRQCFLPATLVDPVRTDAVLVFRGENQKYSSPLISPVGRAAQIPDALCDGTCTPTQVMKNLTGLILNLIERVSKERPMFYGGYEYDKGAWDLTRQPDQALFDNKKKPGLMDVLASSHFRGAFASLEATSPNNGANVPLDPFVSFTPSPQVAEKFARSYEKSGRIYVMMVPRTSLRSVSSSSCRDSKFLMKSLKERVLYDFSTCVRAAVYGSELELDAILETPREWVAGYTDSF